MVSSSFPLWSLVSKEYHFEHFLLKSQVIIEIAGLGLLMLFMKMSRVSQKDWNCSRFWLGNLYKHVRKYRPFFTLISVTKHSFLDISRKLSVSDKQMISISLTFMYPSKRDNLVNSWTARPFKFQPQNLRAELLRGSGLDSISPDLNKRIFLMYKQCKTTDKTTYIKQCKRTYVRIYIIVKLIGDIMEKYMLTFLTGY